MVSLDDIQRFRSQFERDENGYYYKGEVICLYGDLAITNARLKDEKLIQIQQYQNYILQDLWNLGTILYKLEWIRLRTEIDESLISIWWNFSTVDIEHFLIEFRSIFDYTSKIIKEAANKPGQVKFKSFAKLQNRLKNNQGYRAKLGDELACLVESVDWFPDTRAFRDSVIHLGAYTIVFLDPKEGILFQLYGDNLQPFIKNHIVMYNQNVVDFQLYSVLYLCKLFLFLEELANTIRLILKIPKAGSNGKIYSIGFNLLMQWLDRLAEKMKIQKVL